MSLTLPFDTLTSVFEFIADHKTLFNCCLVSKAFREAALPSLYQEVDFRPLLSDGASHDICLFINSA